jgi:hypothetical protein
MALAAFLLPVYVSIYRCFRGEERRGENNADRSRTTRRSRPLLCCAEAWFCTAAVDAAAAARSSSSARTAPWSSATRAAPSPPTSGARPITITSLARVKKPCFWSKLNARRNDATPARAQLRPKTRFLYPRQRYIRLRASRPTLHSDRKRSHTIAHSAPRDSFSSCLQSFLLLTVHRPQARATSIQLCKSVLSIY